MKKMCVVLCFLLFHFLYGIEQAFAITRSRSTYEKSGHVIWEVKTNKKMVALTFDDGPSPTYTPQILDLLAKYQAKATFFVIGSRVKQYPELVRRQALEGHEIANHTYHHMNNHNISASTLKKELEQTAQVIRQTVSITPSLYRPVGGYYNDTIINTAVESGYLVTLWSWHQDPKDWSKPGVDQIVYNIISDTRNGDIILLHDSGGDRSQTVKALELILGILKREGFECVTVSELLLCSTKHGPSPFQSFYFSK